MPQRMRSQGRVVSPPPAHLGSSSKMYWMPWPWWISQSTMRILGTHGKGLAEGWGPHLQPEPRPGWEGRVDSQQPAPAPAPAPAPPWASPTVAAQHTPVQPVFLLSVFGCYGHVIEHAESIGSSPLAVVPRRPRVENGPHQGHPDVPTCGGSQCGGQLSPYQGKPVAHSSCQHRIHQLQPGSRS